MTDTQTLPENNTRSHELFTQFDEVITAMKEHRSDDLIGAWHNLASLIERAEFPALIVRGGDLVCPHCKQVVENDPECDNLTDLRSYDWDSQSYSLYRETRDGKIVLAGSNDRSVDWASLYIQHDCGSAVSIPPIVELELE